MPRPEKKILKNKEGLTIQATLEAIEDMDMLDKLTHMVIFNSCHDLHTEWLKSDECKKEIARVLHYRFGKHYESSEIKIATSAISRYLGGEK